MSTPAYYQEEARKCRELAAASPGSEAAKQWLRFAADYDHLAALLEAGDDPGQQRQSKQEPEDKE